MSSLRIAAAGFATLAVMSAAAPARAGGGVRVTPVQARFPDRALVLTLPTGMALDRRSVLVLENGEPAADTSVVAARTAPLRSFGFILALDASNSMQGAPVAAAREAARAFAAERAPDAPLGIVAFNSTVKVGLEPSTDAAAIDSALSRRPRLAEGTLMRDGVREAIALLRSSGVRAGSVVVLSDGADIGSRIGATELVRLARAAGIRIFTVGLRSPQFEPDALRRLASATGGRYAEADNAAALAPIYRSLGHALASEYLVRYRSDAGNDRRVHVTVRVAGIVGDALLTYRTPRLAGAVYHESSQHRFWRSVGAIAAIAALAAALAAAAVVLALRALRRTVADRVAPYVRPGLPAHLRDESVTERITLLVDRSLAHVRGWRAFAAEVEIARIPISAAAVAAAAFGAAMLVGPLVALLTGQPLLILLGLAPLVAARALVKRRLADVRRRFEDELPDNIQVLASALRTGYGLSVALGVVARDAVEPACSEFERALADERLGVPLEDALTAVARRMASDDLEHVALVAALHRQTGGNTAEVLDRVHDTVRERAELRRTVRSLTAEGQMTRWVLTALPVVIAAAIVLLNPGYLQPFVESTPGRLLLALAVAMDVAGSFAIKRIVEIEP